MAEIQSINVLCVEDGLTVVSCHVICYTREGVWSSWCSLPGLWSDRCVHRNVDSFPSDSSLRGACICRLSTESVQTLASAGSLHMWTLWRLFLSYLISMLILSIRVTDGLLGNCGKSWNRRVIWHHLSTLCLKNWHPFSSNVDRF